MRSLFLLLALAACNDKVKHTPDAAVHDAQGSGSADAAPQPVTITVTRAGQPQVGIAVYFQNADSTLVTSMTTDQTGTASTIMAAGGFVTAIDPFQPPLFGGVLHNLQTYAGVKPGDHLLLDQKLTTGSAVTVTAPLDTTTGAQYYFVFSTCDAGTGGNEITPAGSGATPGGQITLYDCGAQADFLVVSYDNDRQALDFFFQANVAVAAQIDLTGTYQAATLRNYTYSNIPDAYASVDINEGLASARGLVWSGAIGANNNGGTAQNALSIPAFTGAIDILDTRVYTGIGLQHLAEWGPFSTTYTLDVGARLLPALDQSPSIDVANRSVTWTYAPGGATPDTAWTTMRGNRTNLSWDWTIVGPHTGASLAFPVLPAPVDSYNLAAGDTGFVDMWRIARVPGGYDAIRAAALSLTDGAQLVTGATGSVTFEELAPLARTVPHALRRRL